MELFKIGVINFVSGKFEFRGVTRIRGEETEKSGGGGGGG